MLLYIKLENIEIEIYIKDLKTIEAEANTIILNKVFIEE